MHAIDGTDIVLTAQIRRAYLALLVGAHPDKGGSPEAFQRLHAAHAVLSAPAQRAAYDDRLDLFPRSHARTGPDGRPSCSAVTLDSLAGGGRQPDREPASQQNAVSQEDVAPSSMGASAREQASSPAADIASVTEQLRRLLLSKDAGSAAAQSLTSDEELSSNEEIAGLYAERAKRYAQLRRWHHAHFDAEEALLRCPDQPSMARLLEEVRAGSAAAKSANEAGSTAAKSVKEASAHAFAEGITYDPCAGVHAESDLGQARASRAAQHLAGVDVDSDDEFADVTLPDFDQYDDA